MKGSVSDTPAADLQAESWEQDALALAGELDDLEGQGLDTRPPFSCRFQTIGTGTVFPPDAGALLECPSPMVVSGGKVFRVTGTLAGLRPLVTAGAAQGRVWTLLDFVTASGIQSRHNLSGWVRALMVGSLPPEIRPEELRIFRLGGRSHGARRYCFPRGTSSRLPEPTSGQAGKDVVMLTDPAAVLKNLVDCFFEGRRAPLPLYPELADKLAVSLKAGMTNEDLREEAENGWSALVRDRNTPLSALRDCIYRINYLNRPDFSGDTFRRAWEELYRDGGIL